MLIVPPFYRLYKYTHSVCRYPLALGYLSGAIKKETDWDVLSYYADLYPKRELWEGSYISYTGFGNYLNNLKDISKPIWQEIKSTILEYKPTVIGISVNSPSFASSCLVAKLAKEINKQTIVIAGGPHPTMVGTDVFSCPDIDVSVRGEGENTIVELLNAIAANRGLDDIKGISYRKDGQIIQNAPREFIEDLDSLCFPHESAPEVLKDYDRYPLSAFSSIFAIRGCLYSCSFCSSHKIWSQKIRFRSAENVIREIKSLQKKGINLIRFEDDAFGVNKEYIYKLCIALIKDCPGLQWVCQIHVKLVDKSTIALMKAAGCVAIYIGIESGNNEILKKIRKNITIEEALSACKIIKRQGIMLHTYFMGGFPEETEKTLKQTIAAMKKTRSESLSYSIFTPYPGTEAFEFCKKNGLIDNNYDISLIHYHRQTSYFCRNITPERFRKFTHKIQKMVDRKNLNWSLLKQRGINIS